MSAASSTDSITTFILAVTNQVIQQSEKDDKIDIVTEISSRLAAFKGALSHDAEYVCATKLIGEGVPAANARLFLANLRAVLSGDSAFIRENAIVPVENLPRQAVLAGLASSVDVGSLIKKVVICKLNGGLGTSMGLDKAKSLLTVKNGKTFLDLIAQQTLHLRDTFKGANVRFMLMDSFSTSDDTQAFFAAEYPDSFGPEIFKREVEFMQSKVPKIVVDSKLPVSYPANAEMEWCPPGHGEFYTALASSGKLDALIEQGFEYLFVSNSDNLGATLNVDLLAYVAKEKLDFCMEVCEREPVDSKGGHLVRDAKSARLILRESAQVHADDAASAGDIAKHKFFNTNNMWVNLTSLKKAIVENSGCLPLPVIMNSKTVNPTDSKSQKVYQLENAMGCAISYFGRSQAVVVERDRFAPVKTSADLLALRSDVFEETDDKRLVLRADRNGKPPVVKMQPDECYKFVKDMELAMPEGAPSMKDCSSLTVNGPIRFAKGIVLQGNVVIKNASTQRKTVAAGTYTGEVNL